MKIGERTRKIDIAACALIKHCQKEDIPLDWVCGRAKEVWGITSEGKVTVKTFKQYKRLRALLLELPREYEA